VAIDIFVIVTSQLGNFPRGVCHVECLASDEMHNGKMLKLDKFVYAGDYGGIEN
jgi:hypothetical protein